MHGASKKALFKPMADEFTPRAQIEAWFPNSVTPGALTVSSPEDLCYNCVAWSLGINTHWVQPYADNGVQVAPWAIWPNQNDRGSGIDIYVKMYRGEGFVKASRGNLEAGFDKVVIYWDKAGQKFTHVARQMENGQWWSKLGRASDVHHLNPDSLGPVGSPAGYGQVWGYMKRAKGKANNETPLQVRIKSA